ncbi:hypothetical protein HJC23_005732 [Cyclotella cryptica]|uniref:Uncharacterized protein n=1 Tax=Cyclotella cryptica TaxID=29204 RepID=A0ABD3QF87_9STRA
MMRIFNIAFITILSLGASGAKPSNVTMAPKGKSKAHKEPPNPLPKGPGIPLSGPLIDPVDNKDPPNVVAEEPPSTVVVIPGSELEEEQSLGTAPTTSMSLSMSMVADPEFEEWSTVDEISETSLSMVADPEFEEWSTLDEVTTTSMSMVSDPEFDEWAVFEIPAVSVSTSMSMLADPEFGEWAAFELPDGSMSLSTMFSMSLSMSVSPSSSAEVTANSKAGKTTLPPPSSSPVSVKGKAEKPTQSPVGKTSKEPVNIIKADAGLSDEPKIETTDGNTDRTWTQSPLMTSSSQSDVYATSINILVLLSCIVAVVV